MIPPSSVEGKDAVGFLSTGQSFCRPGPEWLPAAIDSGTGNRERRTASQLSAATSFEILVSFFCEPIEFPVCNVPFQLGIPGAGRVVVEPACERAKFA